MVSIFDAIKNINIITIGQGSDYEDTVTLYQDEDHTIPYDLTGCEVVSQLKTLNNLAAGSFTCVITDAVNGVITRTMPKSRTNTLTPHPGIQYVYGVQVIDALGKELPEIQGGVIVIAGIVASQVAP